MAVSWKGSISFGLIYIPIALHIAAQEKGISFNQLHKETKQRIRYIKTCEDCNNPVSNEDIVKGYEYDKGKYVIFNQEDFDKLKTERDKSIMIQQFVNLEEIDPIFYQKSYYIVPQGAEKAFELLKKAMREENKVGIAKVVLTEKESLVALRINNQDMLLSTLFFSNEIKKSPSKELNVSLDDKEIKLAKEIINSMTEPFKPDNFRDEYNEKVLQAIETKIRGEEIVAPIDKKVNKAIDLMDALQKSLQATKGKESRVTH